jgi:uncharacterized protein YegP (UPF0339 family)
MASKFELKRAANGQFMFNLLADSGGAILCSETYRAKASAVNGIESVRKNCVDDARFIRSTAANGKFYFVLKARNGEIIGASPMHLNAASRDQAIEACKLSAATAPTDDKTG